MKKIKEKLKEAINCHNLFDTRFAISEALVLIDEMEKDDNRVYTVKEAQK